MAYAAAALATLLVAGLATAPRVTTFDLKDPKGVNSLTFHLDGGMEPFAGTATDLSGSVILDLDKPEASTGTVVIATKSVTMGLAPMSDNMQSEFCFDADNHPTIQFKLTSLKNVKKEGETIKADATGEFTLRGVTKTITVPVTAVRLPRAAKSRMGKGPDGDLLRVVTNFTIDRFDHKVGTTLPKELCSAEVAVRISIIGTALDKD